MKHRKPKIDPEKVLQTIAQTLQELSTGIKTAKLSTADIAELREGFQKIELLAYKGKLKLKIMDFSETNPDASTREAMLHLLTTLPDNLPANMLSDLAGFVAMEWERRVELVAV